MPKIINDDGIIAEFESYEVLKNGSIFLNECVMHSKECKVEIKPPIISEPIPHIIRKAWAPKNDTRLGVMCPKCHQSRIISINNDISISCLADSSQFIIFKAEDWTKEKVSLYDITNLKDLIRFLNEDDFYVANVLETERDILSIETFVAQFKKDTVGLCPLCNESAFIQEWVNEFAVPHSPFFHTCRVCGGEMMIDTTKNFNGKGNSQILRCEECNHEQDYNLIK